MHINQVHLCMEDLVSGRATCSITSSNLSETQLQLSIPANLASWLGTKTKCTLALADNAKWKQICQYINGYLARTSICLYIGVAYTLCASKRYYQGLCSWWYGDKMWFWSETSAWRDWQQGETAFLNTIMKNHTCTCLYWGISTAASILSLLLWCSWSRHRKAHE